MTSESIVLDRIPFTVDRAALARRLQLLSRTAGGPPGAAEQDALNADLDALAAEAERVARPKALYRPGFIETRDGERTVIDGVTFTSRVLAVNLAGAHRVFAFVATCGTEIAGWGAGLADPLGAYGADALAEFAVLAAMDHLVRHLGSVYGLSKAACMNPGSLEDWPLTEQAPLFRFLGDVEGSVGVRLTESLLMLPTKSVSGIRFPTDVTFESCMLCPRDSCPNRRAPHDLQLFAGRYSGGGPRG
jgi:hypothetical protein